MGYPPYTVISNCILPTRGDSIWSNGSPVELRYSCVGEGAVGGSSDWLTWGPGNVQADPCFVDPGSWDPNGTLDDPNDDFFVEGDYHLKSQAGRWDPVSESWIKDEVTSPWINMGVYGGTAEASKSYFGEPACETIIAGDINGDRKVDFQDFVIVALHWPGSDIEAPPDDSGAQRPGR